MSLLVPMQKGGRNAWRMHSSGMGLGAPHSLLHALTKSSLRHSLLEEGY